MQFTVQKLGSDELVKGTGRAVSGDGTVYLDEGETGLEAG